MPTCSLLLQPSFNRVYTKQAPAVVTAELELLDRLALDGALGPARVVERGGAPFVEVDPAAGPDDLATTVLRNLSAAYLLFTLTDDGDLRPLDVAPLARYDDDLLTTMRYSGKTNEQLTHLLVNLALGATAEGWARMARGDALTLLDPLAGRGTTLNQGLQYGLDVVGIEADEGDAEAYHQFVIRWLKDKRAKHASKAWRYKRPGAGTAQPPSRSPARKSTARRAFRVALPPRSQSRLPGGLEMALATMPANHFTWVSRQR